MPLISNDLTTMDAARLQMIEALKHYIAALRKELEANELILATIEASIAAAVERQVSRPTILRHLNEPRSDVAS